MQNNYTQEELLQYIYNELDPEDYKNVENELNDNYELKKEFNTFKKIVKHLDHISENPSQTSIDMILEYSKSQSIISSEQ